MEENTNLLGIAEFLPQSFKETAEDLYLTIKVCQIFFWKELLTELTVNFYLSKGERKMMFQIYITAINPR